MPVRRININAGIPLASEKKFVNSGPDESNPGEGNAFGPLWGKKGEKKTVAVEMDSSIFHEQGHLSVTGKSPSSLHQFNKDSK